MNHREFFDEAVDGDLWVVTKKYLRASLPWRKDGDKKKFFLGIVAWVSRTAWSVGKYLALYYIFVIRLYPQIGYEKTVIFIILLIAVILMGRQRTERDVPR